MKKLTSLIGILFIATGSSFAQSINIPLYPGNGGEPDGPRSEIEVNYPTATLEENVLTLDFTNATAVQIAIVRQRPHQAVYTDTYSSTTQLIIDLGNEGIGEGSYFLCLYAFGEWWIGEFEIEGQ